MTHTEKKELRVLMCAHTMTIEPDPSRWLLVLRGIAERAGLRPERTILIGATSLELVCDFLVEEASNQGLSPEYVRAAL